MSRITEDDIQENFSLKIDGYPLLKKFRGDEEYTSWEFLQEMKFFSGLVFKGIVYISENRVMAEIYPLFKPETTIYERIFRRFNFVYDPILESFSNLTLKEYLANKSHKKLENFIIQQLNISGIVHPSLLQQPDSPNRLIQFTFYVRDKSLEETYFHNDQNFFNIITYFKKSNSIFNPVFGSNILFTDQSKFTYHASAYPQDWLSRKFPDIPDISGFWAHELHGRYPEKFGKVSTIQKGIIDLYTNERKNPYNKEETRSLERDLSRGRSIVGKQNSILRGIYNSGDSLLLSDMLVKHSAIKPDEINGNILKIGIVDRTEETIESEVKVCSSRKQIIQKDITNRGIISIFVNISPPEVELLPSSYSFDFTPHEVPEIPEANLRLDEYGQFLHNLTDNTDGCFELFNRVKIKSRGGKYKKRIHKTKRKSRN